MGISDDIDDVKIATHKATILEIKAMINAPRKISEIFV